MNKKKYRLVYIMLALAMCLSLSGCGSKSGGNYQLYIKSLITANYLGIPGEYVKLTGANEEDAEALYLQNVTRLADNLSVYYGLEVSGDEQLAPAMVDLAKKIYGKAKFDVGKSYRDNNINYVDVTIYPIDILNQTNDDVEAYVEKFNTAVDNGDYNNYTKDEYEYEFASGIIGILADAVNNAEYADPQTVKVRIITSDDSYYIGSEDLQTIDLCILAAAKDGTTDDASVEETGDDASPGDGTE